MIEFLLKLLLTFNSTSWVIVIFGIKKDWSLFNIHPALFSVLLLLIPVLTSGISLLVLRSRSSKDELHGCKEIENANNAFTPTYLGYFFVGLGVDNWRHLLFVYFLIFIFTFIAQAQYFNPIYLLFGYKFYYVTTNKGTRIFIITQRHLRNSNEGSFEELQRINNTTFIELRRKNESFISKD